MAPMSDLEKELEAELLAILRKCETLNPPYQPTYLMRMLTSTNPRYYKGPVGTVTWLMIGKERTGIGFNRLVKEGKLDWTIEALIQDPKWKPLFPDWVIANAKARINAATQSA